MAVPNITVFSIILGVVFITLDAYVLFCFQRFIRKHGASSWWTRIAWIVGGAAFVTYAYVAWRRHLFRLDGMDLGLFMAACFWYLPKLPIALVLLMSQLVQTVLRVLFRTSQTPKPPNKIELMETASATEIQAVSGTTVSAVGEVDVGRRSMLGKVMWGTAAVPYAIVANGMLRTLYDFQVTQEEVVLPGLPRTMDGFRLVQLSDVHAGSFPDYRPFQEVVRLVREQRPNAVVITGDFVNALPKELAVIARELERLTATNTVYATLGNHDHYNTLEEHRQLVTALRDFGVDVLNNEHRRIGQGADGFVLAGIDNIGSRQTFGDLNGALRGVHEDEPTILLAHDPSLWDKEIVGKRSVNLMLSGHTHGGQVNVGMFGIGLSLAGFVYEQVAGMYRKGEQLLYVNCGIGTVGPPLRVGVPPEITVFTLRSPRITDNYV